ncbi:MAG: SDR family oxidoreductase [Ignavibacteriales bacterium]|nr:SDR family oxidoreductase [Ignavibacteriales bacterium]
MKTEKIFLLFGSTGDLGKVAVEYFLNQDYDYCYFFARRQYKLGNAKNNFVIINADDFTNEENVIDAFSKVRKDSNATYFLFNTIGGFTGGNAISETIYNDFLKMININLGTSFLIAKHFTKLVYGTKGGSICFTSALSSLKPEANKAAYNISKNGLNMLVKSLALECSNIGLSANAVAPFIIDTKSNREWVKDITQLVSPVDICSVVNSLFENYKVSSGNIVELPFSLR